MWTMFTPVGHLILTPIQQLFAQTDGIKSPVVHTAAEQERERELPIFLVIDSVAGGGDDITPPKC